MSWLKHKWNYSQKFPFPWWFKNLFTKTKKVYIYKSLYDYNIKKYGKIKAKQIDVHLKSYRI
jgi:hypothetical protein